MLIKIQSVVINGNRANSLVLEVSKLLDKKLSVFIELEKNIPAPAKLMSSEDGSFHYAHFFYSIENKINPSRIFYINELGNEIELYSECIVGSNCDDKFIPCFNRSNGFGNTFSKSIKIIRDGIIYFSNGSCTPLEQQFWGDNYSYEHYLLNEM